TTGHAISTDATRPTDDRPRRAASGLSVGADGRAQAGRIQEPGRTGNPRPAVYPKGKADAQSGTRVHPWRTTAANDAWVPSDGCVQLHVCRQPVSRQPRVRGAVGELSHGHHVRPCVSTTAKRWSVGGVGISGCLGRGKVPAVAALCGRAKDRIVGRLL